MELTARVIIDLPLEEGVSKAGNAWRKKSWVVETFGNFPKKVKVDVFGRSIDNVHLEMGKVYNMSIDAESREFNGRWYTDINCFAAREADPNAVQQPAGGYQQAAPAAPAAPMAGAPTFPDGNNPFAAPGAGAPGGSAFEDSTDDLPF